MTQTRSVRATSPADLLALVPAVLGFHPEDSLVVMTVGEAVHRVHARVDLPTGGAEREELAAHLVAVVRDNGVRTVALLAYTVDVSLAEVVVTDLHRRLRAARVEVVCAVRADGRRWWSLGRGRRAHPGVRYDVGSHPFMAEAVLAGTVVLGSRQELADSLVGTDLVDARLVL